ncbi:outer membrane protein assembly factor BamB [Thiohalorhabdus methylotrophus]|uniref:Outer membrane protein assembly factor BamB n=1 Tax=Thiohalorhabdus methylotrophus TaxID=3242694 RepID=A0ABV4TWB6_9GAMM
MKAWRLFPGLVLALALVFPPSAAHAAEEEDGGPDPAAFSAYRSWAMPVFKDWSVRPYTSSRMAERNGQAYVGTREGRLYSVDAESGGISWVRDLGGRFAGGPAISENGERVYIGTDEGEVWALKTGNGETIWKSQVSSEVITVPRMAAGMVFVRTADDFLWALRAADGGTRWSYNVEGRSLALRGGSRPAYFEGKVFSGFSTGELVALDAGNGSPQWRESIATPTGRTELERMVDVDAAPVVLDGIVYAAAYHGSVSALQAGSGRQLWQRKFSVHNDLAVAGQRIFIATSDSKVVALDRDNGGTLWTQKVLQGAGSLSAPVLTERAVVVGDGQGRVTWFARESGKVLAQMDVGLSAVHSPPLPVGEGALLVLTDEGTLNRVGLD